MQWSYDLVEIFVHFNGFELLRQCIKLKRPSFSVLYLKYCVLLLLLSFLLPVWGADDKFQYFWKAIQEKKKVKKKIKRKRILGDLYSALIGTLYFFLFIFSFWFSKVLYSLSKPLYRFTFWLSWPFFLKYFFLISEEWSQLRLAKQIHLLQIRELHWSLRPEVTPSPSQWVAFIYTDKYTLLPSWRSCYLQRHRQERKICFHPC